MPADRTPAPAPTDEIVAVAVYAATCERLPDGSLVLHDCNSAKRRIVAPPYDLAPWMPREEQAALLRLASAALRWYDEGMPVVYALEQAIAGLPESIRRRAEGEA